MMGPVTEAHRAQERIRELERLLATIAPLLAAVMTMRPLDNLDARLGAALLLQRIERHGIHWAEQAHPEPEPDHRAIHELACGMLRRLARPHVQADTDRRRTLS